MLLDCVCCPISKWHIKSKWQNLTKCKQNWIYYLHLNSNIYTNHCHLEHFFAGNKLIEKFCRKGHLQCEPLTVDNNFKIALRGDGGEGCQIILTDSQDEDSVPSEPPNSFFLIPDYFANFQIFPDVNYVCKVFQYVTILQPSVFRKKAYKFAVQYSKKWSLMRECHD